MYLYFINHLIPTYLPTYLSPRLLDRVANANKEKRAAQLHGMRSEQELRREMEAIERAAREAVAQDRDSDYGSMFVQVL